MKTRIAVVFFAMALFALAGHGANGFTGSWDTTWQSLDYPGVWVPVANAPKVTLEVYPEQDHHEYLDGTWAYADAKGIKHVGVMHGRVTGGVWQGVWWAGSGKNEHGTFDFNLSGDGKSFSGTYTQAGRITTKLNAWKGTRL